jgi:chromosome segregation ATPase
MDYEGLVREAELRSKQLSDLEAELRRLRSDLESQKRELETKTRQISDLESKQEEYLRRIRALEQEVTFITEESQSIIKEFSIEREKLKMENDRLESICIDRLMEIERKSFELGKLLIRLALVYAELERVTSKTV